MDDLLHRLRHDMVELSSQGDNFTQQIWLMYGQFEQVVDRFNPPINSVQRVHSPRPTRRRHRQQSAKMTTTVQQPQQQVVEKRFDLSESESDSEPEVLPSRQTGRGLYGSRSRPGLNPLLETISVIGDLCDSDDAVDGPASGALYAGSNSVDSGYKSSCPTPDLAQDASNYISGRPPVLKSRRTLPAVPVGSSSAASASAGNHQIDGPLDLDHLTSLRRTLLTAIERYDTRTKELDRDLTDNRRPRSISPAAEKIRSRSCAASRSCRLAREASADQVRSLAADPAQPPVDAVSGGQDGASRFSRVARCMLEIIEDLQRQQQQQQQVQQPCPAASSKTPIVPPKPSRMARSGDEPSAAAAPATPPRVARRGRRKLPTPQPPPESDGRAPASGECDYHLYEEIIYDLGTSKSPIGGKCPPARPPPLPARPSRPSPPIISSSSKPWLNVIKPLRRDRNNQLIRDSQWTQMTKLHSDVIARSNVYTFGSGVSQAQPPNATTFSKPHRSVHEDEYGFRAVSHMV